MTEMSEETRDNALCIEKGICPICGCTVDISQFRDNVDKAQYNISGICMPCQFHLFDSEGNGCKASMEEYLYSIPEYRMLVKLAVNVLNISLIWSEVGGIPARSWNALVQCAKDALGEGIS